MIEPENDETIEEPGEDDRVTKQEELTEARKTHPKHPYQEARKRLRQRRKRDDLGNDPRERFPE